MKQGRSIEYKCIYCGKYVPYDRRITEVRYYVQPKFNIFEEQYLPEDIVEMNHKKCKRLKEKK